MQHTTAEETDDSTLLAGLRNREAKAFERLMRRYNRRLFRAARGIVRDDAEAQDAVQEAYLHAFLSIASFRAESSLATWLTRIVINQALTQQRRAGRLVFLGDAGSDEEADMPHPTQAAAGGTSPEDELATLQLRLQLQHAVNLLPPIYRSVFILRAVEGLDVQETADALAVSTDVVKTRLVRARSMLRAQLAPVPEADARHLYEFQGARCDETVAVVLARLRALGIVRDH